MSDEKISAKIPHFNGLHYDHWSELMENLLCAKGLWSLVEKGFEEPCEGTTLTETKLEQLETARTNDHKVKHYLFRAIDRSIFKQALDRRTSKIVWDSLKRKFGGNDRVKKPLLNSLRREFEVLEMKETETITEYFARVMAVANKMRSNGEDMPDSKSIVGNLSYSSSPANSGRVQIGNLDHKLESILQNLRPFDIFVHVIDFICEHLMMCMENLGLGKQPGIAIGRLCEKCDGKCVICDSYVRPCTLVRVCDECNYGSFQGRCVICGGVGISDAYYCKECTQQEKDRDGCPKIVNLGSAKTDLFYEPTLTIGTIN
ncbi:PHF5-like [Dillenia turbinata]|uniref:PHF5-like n=1 Tax=Dillenia turbinata TaxID=194707 RepID=A0AAN8VTZ6_9MAGN